MGALEERLDCIPSYHSRDVTDCKLSFEVAVGSHFNGLSRIKRGQNHPPSRTHAHTH